MEAQTYDIAVIGGGILGMATAMALLQESSSSLVLLEAEDRIAPHQTGNNSGVIHSGLYYRPGSLKAENCAKGREDLYRFCDEQSIPYERCGKVVVATSDPELPMLAELQKRGEANGLMGLKRLTPEEIREHEPHTRGIMGLHVPQTGIVDFTRITEKMAELVKERGGKIRLSTRFKKLKKKSREFMPIEPS